MRRLGSSTPSTVTHGLIWAAQMADLSMASRIPRKSTTRGVWSTTLSTVERGFSLGSIDGGLVSGQPYSAKECYEKALEHDPENSNSWITLGSIDGGLVIGQSTSVKGCYERGLEHDPEYSGAWFSLGSIDGGLVNGQPYSAKECYILSPSSSAVRTDLFIIARRAAFVVEPHAKHASGEAQQNPSRRRGFFVGLRLGQRCEM